MKTNIFAFSERGSALALRISGYYENCEIHSVEKFAVPHGFTAHKSVCADMGELFREAGLLIFIGACGIAVRDIAPHLKSKTTDPAVLVLDDAGTFVIPILSGHIGGANRMARDLASKLGATPVITTATDVSGRFSVDAWAAEHGFAISSMKTAKDISAAILMGDVPVTAEKPLPAELPAGLTAGETGALGIYIGIRTASPFAETLRLCDARHRMPQSCAGGGGSRCGDGGACRSGNRPAGGMRRRFHRCEAGRGGAACLLRGMEACARILFGRDACRRHGHVFGFGICKKDGRRRKRV